MKKKKFEETSNRLYHILATRQMSAAELSQKSGVSEASISQYINGSHKPSNISAGKMAAFLDCSPLWLMGFDVPMEAIIDPVDQEYLDAIDRMRANQKLSSYTEEEADIVLAYRNADDLTKQMVKKILNI